MVGGRTLTAAGYSSFHFWRCDSYVTETATCCFLSRNPSSCFTLVCRSCGAILHLRAPEQHFNGGTLFWLCFVLPLKLRSAIHVPIAGYALLPQWGDMPLTSAEPRNVLQPRRNTQPRCTRACCNADGRLTLHMYNKRLVKQSFVAPPPPNPSLEAWAQCCL